MTYLPDALIEAYRTTSFRVQAGDQHIDLRIGERNSDLIALHAAHHVNSSVFITAWNPRSENLTDGRNNEAQRRLAAEVKDLGFEAYPGVGISTTSDWPPEESLLVLGIGQSQATQLGKRYGQNAIVFVGEEGIPVLMFPKHMPER